MANTRKIVRAHIDKLVDIVDRQDELPEDVESAINDLLSAVDDDTKVPAWKAPFYKDGKFSKTAAFTTVANVIVLLAYFIQSFFTGSTLDLGFFTWTIPAFDVAAAAAILAVCNGTYVGNNLVKVKASGHG